MLLTELTTYKDLFDHLQSVSNLTAEGFPMQQMLVGVQEGYRRLFDLHDWRYYVRTYVLNLQAEYNTGTIAYSSTTGEVTLTGGTWPTSAVYGAVEIDRVFYTVSRRVSSTVLLLNENNRPGQTYAAGTSYRYVQYRYLLPFDLADVREAVDPRYPTSLIQISAEDAMFLQDARAALTVPSRYALVPSEYLPGRWEMWVPTSPVDTRALRLLYEARHKPLTVLETNAGTVSVTGDVATFTSPVLTEAHIGCVLRIATDSQVPTGRTGSVISRQYTLRPFAMERVILSVTDSYTAVISPAIDGSPVSARGYTLSQLADVDPGTMKTLLLRLIESEYTKVARLSDKQQELGERSVQAALIAAKEGDSHRIKAENSTAPAWYRGRLRDLPAQVIN